MREQQLQTGQQNLSGAMTRIEELERDLAASKTQIAHYERQMKEAEEKYARETQASNNALQEISETCVSGAKLRDEIQIRLNTIEAKYTRLLPEYDQLVAAAQQKDALLAQ
eukprot:8002305-Alexandrium_andersonii.AAC.1